MVKVTSLQDYQRFQQVWLPRTEENQSLFLVRIPPALTQMTWTFYRELMVARVQWLIDQWMTTEIEDQSQTHQRLVETLYRLSSNEIPPDLTEDPLWGWAMDWGEALILNNETWGILFQGSTEQEFPVTLPEATSSQATLMELHDEVKLDQFLADLAYGL